jgi:putative CocE/NonD family hydrolase
MRGWKRQLAAALLAVGLAPPLTAHAQSAPGAFGAYRPAPAYAEAVTTSLYLPMRDGVKIAMQIMRPARNGQPIDGRFPVIWQATLDLPGASPEQRQERGEGGDWARLVKQGYVIVDVARRGSGASFGIRRGYHDREEAYDAYEITEWLAKQPWSNGMIGMHGCSNTGEAVMHALTVAPPHLKAAWAGCFSWSKYDGFLRGGGIIANWGAGPQRTFEQDMTARPVDGDADKKQLALAARGHLQNVDLFALMKTIPFRDSWSPLTRSRFAAEGSVASYADQLAYANIPLYVQGGWYDDFRKEGLIALANLPNTHIVIGPWKHCANNEFDLVGEAQRFFDFYLKGVDTGIQRDDPIHYFVVGAPKGQEWRAAKTWTTADQNTVLFLGKGGALTAKAGQAAQASFQVSYANKCPDSGSPNQTALQPCHPAAGAVRFAGERLTKAVELTGSPVIRVWMSSSAPDANVFAYLEDVAPDGAVTALTEGRQKASLRKRSPPPWQYLGLPWMRGYAEDAQPLKPGEPAELVFDMLPLSYIVAPGHRLQVSFAGADPRERARTEVSPAPTVAIYSGGARASSVSLPIRSAKGM